MPVLQHVPIIDIAPLWKPQEESRILEVIGSISKACEEWGFFYVVNHPISKDLISSTVEETKKFFNLPKEKKKLVERFEGNFQGFSDSELTKQKVDKKEIFDYSWEDEAVDENKLKSVSGIHGRNQWPSTNVLPEFKPAMLTYFKELRGLALLLMDAVFRGLKTQDNSKFDVGSFIQFAFSPEEDTSFGRLNYYPVIPEGVKKEGELGIGPHADAGVLTVLYQEEGVCSLQVLKDGEFYDVPPVKDSFVINIGDMTQVWSNARYQAPIHRVLTNPTKTRISIPFFLNPKYSCMVEPLYPDGTPLYKPISWAEFRKGRVQGDYADLGEELQISHYYLGQK